LPFHLQAHVRIGPRERLAPQRHQVVHRVRADAAEAAGDAAGRLVFGQGGVERRRRATAGRGRRGRATAGGRHRRRGGGRRLATSTAGEGSGYQEKEGDEEPTEG